MHKARSFFFVCAGIFLLAAAYHLGATSATAQAPGFDAAAVNLDVGAAVINRELWHINPFGPPTKHLGGPVPGTARVVACGWYGVVLENGEYWRNDNSGWQFAGSFPFSGPTSATKSTWGELKAKYRPDAPAQDK